jgi:hypothetical protein
VLVFLGENLLADLLGEIKVAEYAATADNRKAAGLERALAGKMEFVASKRLDLYREYLDENKLGY